MERVNESFYLNAMDPGGTTGLALFHITPEEFTLVETAAESYHHITRGGPVGVLESWRGSYNSDPHVLVYENFRARTVRHTVDTTALNVIGELTAWMSTDGAMSHPYTLVVSQEPVHAKNLVTDRVLTRLGMKMSGKDSNHVNDAIRHAVAWLSIRGYLPICRKAWPPSR